MLVRDDLPELGADLVAALAALNVNQLTHFDKESTKTFGKGPENLCCGDTV